jgi:hypothetical protein
MSRKLLKKAFNIEYEWKRAYLEVKTMDFELKMCSPAQLGGHRVRAGKRLPLTGEKKNKNKNNNNKRKLKKVKRGVQHEDFAGCHQS